MLKVLDHGYVDHIESWGTGKAGVKSRIEEDGEVVRLDDYECGIVEGARQSTQGAFRSWDPYRLCEKCSTYVIESGGPGKIFPGEGYDFCDHDWKEYKNGDEGLLRYLFCNKPQHATPFEFSGMVIEVRAPIFVFREWHRHRTQSFNEMSARYAPLPNFNYMPSIDRCFLTSTKNKQAGTIRGADQITVDTAADWLQEQEALYERFDEHYQRGLAIGIPKEIARIGMPVGRYSQMRAQANLRNWLAFVTLRSDPNAMWEIQQFSNAVAEVISQQFPRTYKLFLERRNGEANPKT